MCIVRIPAKMEVTISRERNIKSIQNLLAKTRKKIIQKINFLKTFKCKGENQFKNDFVVSATNGLWPWSKRWWMCRCSGSTRLKGKKISFTPLHSDACIFILVSFGESYEIDFSTNMKLLMVTKSLVLRNTTASDCIDQYSQANKTTVRVVLLLSVDHLIKTSFEKALSRKCLVSGSYSYGTPNQA